MADPQTRPGELHLHLHPFCNEQIWPEFHLHMHPVADGAPPKGFAPPCDPEPLNGVKSVCSVVITRPTASSVPVHVEGSGNTGYICSDGTASDDSSSGIDSIWAQIFSTNPTCPIGGTIPSGSTQGTLTPMGSAFGFHFEKIPGATVGSGSTNFLQVYAATGSALIVHGCAKVQFSGTASNVTECEASGFIAQGLQLAQAPVKVHRVFAGAPGAPAADRSTLVLSLPGPIDLVYRGVAPKGEGGVWEPACFQQAGGVWQLVVENHAGQTMGTLVLRSIEGAKLDAPVVWQTKSWRNVGPNHLRLLTHWEPATTLAEMIVEAL